MPVDKVYNVQPPHRCTSSRVMDEFLACLSDENRRCATANESEHIPGAHQVQQIRTMHYIERRRYATVGVLQTFFEYVGGRPRSEDD